MLFEQKPKILNKLFAIALIVLSTGVSWGQDLDYTIWMRPNAGQWHENIEYKIKFNGGEMYLEDQGFTYNFNNFGEVYGHGHGEEGHDHHGHDHDHGHDAPEVKGHAVKTHFIGSNTNPAFEQNEPSEFYENYFLGSDSSKWKTELYAYKEVIYHELYDGVDLKMHQKGGVLKYDYILDTGVDPTIIQVKYEGQNDLYISNKEIVITTNLGRVVEGKPKAFQMVGGVKQKVECNYVLVDDIISFEFPEGYDETLPLIIDPELTFSTFTGSTADNWGMTACPDENKSLVAGGIVFDTGYPISAGAFDGTFGGGTVDVGITKYNPTGSGIIFSTYIGGSNSETPHSLVVNSNNELYIMGATGSDDFPISGSAFQSTHGGGSFTVVNGISFNKVDIYVLKLNPSGTALMGSTYLGGSDNDGMADEDSETSFNYGDQLRGEVMIDDVSNVYIASTTASDDFPIVGGFDATLGGGQDAVVAKFNSNLSTLSWSTYLGGTGDESGNSVQVSSTGDIFVAGGTTSTNFPSTTGQFKPTFTGGDADGYVVKFNAPTYAAPKASYLGTTDYDQVYFVQLDLDDFVYVYGQTKGNYPISAGRYGNSNSGQFIHKLSNDLTSSEWSSSFGASSGNEELSPTAFLVSDCYEIYVAGWGGETNASNSSAVNSSSDGMPLTSDAYQTVTSGSNFYLGLFTKDMVDLKYGTYMGSTEGSNDHVDGGTSRFDKGGGVYHAVCAACGGVDSGFPTTPGVFSPTNNSPNCNMAAFLFELSKIDASLSTVSPVICIPDPVFFENDSQNGNEFFWDFGDGIGTSTDFEPTYFYTVPGTYTVMLIVSDSSGCYDPDTAYIDVEIQLFEPEVGALSDTICPGASVELFVIGGDSYVWGPADVLDDPTSATPIATIWEATTFTVEITSECGTNTLEVTVEVYGSDANAGGDTAICVGEETPLFASGGGTYQWFPPAWVDDPTSATPNASPPFTTTFTVQITTPEGCELEKNVKIEVDHDLPFPNLADEINLCKGSTVQVIAGGAREYIWSPDYNISDTEVYNPFIWPDVDTSYAVTFINACGESYDTVDINVIEVDARAYSDTTICPEGQASLYATGGVDYEWIPSSFLSDPDSSHTFASPTGEITYFVTVTDEYGCADVASVTVDLYPTPPITVSPTVYAIEGDTSLIWADGDGSIIWSPPTFIACTTCPETAVWPNRPTTYTATLTDENGCLNSGNVPILYDPIIYVPNAFTPDGNSVNPYFFAVTHNIDNFKMYIFNRWGETIKIIENEGDVWDGYYNGTLVKDDVYVWQISYTDFEGESYTLRGHVTVLK